MALITCPECGKQISDRALSCPHCGAPSAHAQAGGVPAQRAPLVDSGTAKAAVTGLAAWAVAPWIARILFVVVVLLFVAYMISHGQT